MTDYFKEALDYKDELIEKKKSLAPNSGSWTGFTKNKGICKG